MSQEKNILFKKHPKSKYVALNQVSLKFVIFHFGTFFDMGYFKGCLFMWDVLPWDILWHIQFFFLSNRFRRRTPSHALRPGTLAFGLHGRRERRSRNVKVARNQGLGARRCQILPREARQHRLLGLSCAGAAFSVLLLRSNRAPVLLLLGRRVRGIQLLKRLKAIDVCPPYDLSASPLHE